LDGLLAGKTSPAILRFNMRQYPFIDVDTFIESFHVELGIWMSKMKTVLESFSIKVNEDITLHWKDEPKQLVDVFKSISQALPGWTILHGKNIPVPILFVDEVNLMRELAKKDANSQSVIKSVFTWLVHMTKEERKFNVVLASSDSLVHNWLSNLVGVDRFQTFVVGHLSKKEANDYWDQAVASNGFNGRDPINFSDVHQICGGNMFLLSQAYEDYVINGIQPSESFLVYQAQMGLIKAMAPDNMFYQDPFKAAPKWKTDDLLFVIHQLTQADGGYVYYQDLIDQIGQTAVDSLTEYNVIHVRPYFSLCKDLDPAPLESKAIVTAESQPGLYVMKLNKKWAQ